MDLIKLLNEAKRKQQLEKLKSDWRFIAKIDDQDEAACNLAIDVSPFALVYIRNQTPEMCAKATDINPYAIMFVENQTVELCMKVLEADINTYGFIRSNHPEVDEYIRGELGSIPDCKVPTLVDRFRF